MLCLSAFVGFATATMDEESVVDDYLDFYEDPCGLNGEVPPLVPSQLSTAIQNSIEELEKLQEAFVSNVTMCEGGHNFVI